MQVLTELSIAYTMISGAIGHVLVTYHLILRSRVMKEIKASLPKASK